MTRNWLAAGFEDTEISVLHGLAEFTGEFDFEAVRLIKTSGLSVAQLSCDLDVHVTVLRRCVKEFQRIRYSHFLAMAS